MTNTWALFWACSRHLCLSPHCWGCRNQAPYWGDNRSGWVENYSMSSPPWLMAFLIHRWCFSTRGKDLASKTPLCMKENLKTNLETSFPSGCSFLIFKFNALQFLLHRTQGGLTRVKYSFFWESPKLGDPPPQINIDTFFKQLPKSACRGEYPVQIDFDLFLFWQLQQMKGAQIACRSGIGFIRAMPKRKSYFLLGLSSVIFMHIPLSIFWDE